MEEIKIKLKPWGKEIWFAETEKYAGKIIEILKGNRNSLHFHEVKHETLYIDEGSIKIIYGIDSKNLQEKILYKGDKFIIAPYTIHRLQAIEDSKIFEVSTPELNDLVKLEDDYGRKGKGLNEELDKELHLASKSTNN